MSKLQVQVREMAREAEQACSDGSFNAMSWLDLALEDEPQVFDHLFETEWTKLSDDERGERIQAIRRVL